MGHFRFCIIWRSFNFLICKKRVTISTSKIVVRSNPIIIICLYTIILLLYLAHVMFWIGSRYWVNIMVVYSYYYYFCNTANDITWVLIMNFLRDFQWLIKRKNWRKIFTIWNFSWEFPWLFFLAIFLGYSLRGLRCIYSSPNILFQGQLNSFLRFDNAMYQSI